MSKQRILNLGSWRAIDGGPGGSALRINVDDLTTHAVVVGMTGSGKSGLVTVLAEEVLLARIPVLLIDVKGDLPNLLLNFPSLEAKHYLPWLKATPNERNRAHEPPTSEPSVEERAEQLVQQRTKAFAEWNLSEADVAAFTAQTHFRLLTPGASSGEPLHVLSMLERRSARWDTDPEAARAALCAAVSLVLRLLGRDPDPARSKDHVLLSVLAEQRLLRGETAELPTLMQDVTDPPIAQIGALPVNTFMRKTDRLRLAAALNTLLASPTFAAWRQGTALDVGAWLTPTDERTPAVIVSVAHLDDEERSLVLGIILEEILSWVRSLPGSPQLNALVVFDEVYGFLPPHPANPPTKRPIVALMKQARAFGVGMVLATQNPMDLDYRALSNAGLWCVGRLQTDADRERVLDGLNASIINGNSDPKELTRTVQRLADRWFVIRNAHSTSGPLLLHPRYALSWLRGPMTRSDLKRALGGGGA